MDSIVSDVLINALTASLARQGESEVAVKRIDISSDGEVPEYKIVLISSDRIICTIAPDPIDPRILVFRIGEELLGIPENMTAFSDCLFMIRNLRLPEFEMPYIPPKIVLPKPTTTMNMPTNAFRSWVPTRPRSVLRHK